MYEIAVTDIGKERLAQSVLDGEKITFSEFKISSEANDNNLSYVIYSALVNNVETNGDEIWVNCVVPEKAGGFWLKYISILDDQNNVIAQGNVPEFFKAQDDLSPTVSDYTVKIKYSDADKVVINFNTQACSTIDNYYQLSESLIRLMNDHSALAWDYAANRTSQQNDQVDLKPIEMRLTELEQWKNNLVAYDIKGEGRYKYTFDLTHLPFSMMYPVTFLIDWTVRHGSPLQVDIFRRYWDQQESDLGGEKTAGEPHVAGVDIRALFLDHSYSGNASACVIKLNYQSYRDTVSNITNMAKVRQEKFDLAGADTPYNSPGVHASEIFAGFFLRGGLTYEVITNSPTAQFILHEKETLIFEDPKAEFNRKWYSAPMPVSEADFGNTKLINL